MNQIDGLQAMKKVEQLIDAMKLLSLEERKQIYRDLKEDIFRLKLIDIDIEKYKGVAGHLWEQDAQEFINELRKDDRY